MVVETGETGSKILRFSGEGIPPAVLAVAKQHSTMWGSIPKYTRLSVIRLYLTAEYGHLSSELHQLNMANLKGRSSDGIIIESIFLHVRMRIDVSTVEDDGSLQHRLNS